MRPFKFFFFVTIAFIIFFSVAKVLLIAAFFAAIMSITFWGIRSIMNFLGRLSWNENYQQRGYYGVKSEDNYLNLEEHPMFRRERNFGNPLERENIIIIK